MLSSYATTTLPGAACDNRPAEPTLPSLTLEAAQALRAATLAQARQAGLEAAQAARNALAAGDVGVALHQTATARRWADYVAALEGVAPPA